MQFCGGDTFADKIGDESSIRAEQEGTAPVSGGEQLQPRVMTPFLDISLEPPGQQSTGL